VQFLMFGMAVLIADWQWVDAGRIEIVAPAPASRETP
jgi:hypothetical protein